MRRVLAGLLLAVMQPALAAQTGTDSASAAGTTIIGEREAAIGLYLAPWQDEHASDLDRPPGLYDVPLQTLDVQRFRRQADYDEAIRDYRRERLYRSR
jgi:multidrug efflux pump subunit AcrA (membrane-fusion protein)